MKICPLEDNFYYEWDDLENEIDTKFGKIAIPEDRPARTRKATVLEVGPECKYLKKGDRILISAFTGAHLFLVTSMDVKKGEALRIARESEVLAKIEE